MPPINYSDYPPNWKTEIRPAILARANHCCEFCGVKNYSVGARQFDGVFTEMPIYPNRLMNAEQIELQKIWSMMNGVKVIKIILTIAHLDHDIKNNDYGNLKALCQRCHNRYDSVNRRENRKKKQPDLFDQ